jgi:hypothetical protein
VENIVTDEEKIDTAKWVLQHHFGIRAIEDKRTVCAGCQTGTAWPCRPALLAQAVQEEVLAR